MISLRPATKQSITKAAKNMGANLVGFASVSRWAEYNEVEEAYRPETIWPLAKTVIVLGVPVLLPIIETTPSINYVELYNTSNILLDQIAYRLSVFLNDHGHAAIFLPRDGYGSIDLLIEKPCAAFSHVFAGKYAGLGTIGFSHLLINEQYGPRVRYVSVFTNLELAGDPVLETDLCRNCLICQRLCPSQAFTARKDRLIADMDKPACARHHRDLRGEYRYPCGICAKTCPVGQDRKLYEAEDVSRYLKEGEALGQNPDDPRYQGWVHCRTHGSAGNRIV